MRASLYHVITEFVLLNDRVITMLQYISYNNPCVRNQKFLQMYDISLKYSFCELFTCDKK